MGKRKLRKQNGEIVMGQVNKSIETIAFQKLSDFDQNKCTTKSKGEFCFLSEY